MAEADELVIATGGGSVSALVTRAASASAALVLAHGAGAGMRHPFMADVADGLAERGITTLRYQFPFMERGGRRPDPPALAIACVRAAVATAAAVASGLPLLAGGKSFGGRMTSLAQAQAELPGVRGLVFFGFPLHAANQPSVTRAAHLGGIRVPMLFLQGGRDALADAELITETATRLEPWAKLAMIEAADHSFHVPKRSGRSGEEVMDALLDICAAWVAQVLANAATRSPL